MRRKAAVAAVVLLLLAAAAVSLTGYPGLFLEADDTTRFVPDEADAAVRVNATAVADDATTDRLVVSLVGVGYDDLLAAVENRTNLDPRGLEEATVFYAGDRTANRSRPYAGVVFRTGWDADDMRDVDGFEVDERSYNAVPFYVVRSNATEETRPFYVAPVARGVYVAGTRAAVRDASDVALWKADAFDAGARDQLGDASVTFAAPNASVVTGVSGVSAEYRPRAGRISVAVELHTSDDASVADVRREVETYLGVAETLADDRLAAVLDRVELNETGTTVVVEHDATVEETAETLRALDARLGWGKRINARLDAYGVSDVIEPSLNRTNPS